MIDSAFNTIAADYDAAFTEHPLGRWLRALVWAYLEEAFQPGDEVLELGCGTGEDALWMAQRGMYVHATDAASAMLDRAKEKAILHGVAEQISFSQLNLTAIDKVSSLPTPEGRSIHAYDGVLANFGVLNCVPDHRELADALARWIRPGGRAVLVVMGPLSPWEWGWYLPRGRVRTAFRRFRSGEEAQLDSGAKVPVWYPSSRQLRQAFAPYFRALKTVGIGVVLPPSFARSLVDRWPRFFERLAAWDRRAGRSFPGVWLNDHYLVVFERTEVGFGEEKSIIHSTTQCETEGSDSKKLMASQPSLNVIPVETGIQSNRSFSLDSRLRENDIPLMTSTPFDHHQAADISKPDISFACPQCGSVLEEQSPIEKQCPKEGTSYWKKEGIWHFLRPEREAYFKQFVREYETIRQAEGRGSEDPAYFRALPFEDLTGRFQRDWRIRATSYKQFVNHILKPIEERRGCPLQILDLGAGNGWLSYRLAQQGHHLVAVDLQTNAFDGLGTHRHYDASFLSMQAEFDHLPFASGQFDLAIFNASFHYATNYEVTLREVLRVLRSEATLTILDTPVYRTNDSGRQMVQEREAYFEKTYGFPSNALACENYLTDARLEELAATFSLQWKMQTPFYGWRWAMRPWVARIRRRRKPARFLLISATNPA